MLALYLTACTKGVDTNPGDKPPSSIPTVPLLKLFTKYTIPQGQQSSINNITMAVAYDELKFVVKFDSSAIYTLSNPGKQYDINKLYGFSDDNSAHHLNSARFGWRWSDSALRLFGYIYNAGVRSSKEIGTVRIGEEANCSIKVAGNEYIFSLNQISTAMPRVSTTPKGSGYKLYPYFGGEEVAPHEVNILIKE